MIEADGTDKNGGVFSYTTESLLLAFPDVESKPTFLKKIGNWNEEEESFVYSPIFLSDLDGNFIHAGNMVLNF